MLKLLTWNPRRTGNSRLAMRVRNVASITPSLIGNRIRSAECAESDFAPMTHASRPVTSTLESRKVDGPAFHLQQWKPVRPFPVVNDVLTWRGLCEHSDTPSRSFKGCCPLYEMQLSVVEHVAEYFEDAETWAQPTSSWPVAGQSTVPVVRRAFPKHLKLLGHGPNISTCLCSSNSQVLKATSIRRRPEF